MTAAEVAEAFSKMPPGHKAYIAGVEIFEIDSVEERAGAVVINMGAYTDELSDVECVKHDVFLDSGFTIEAPEGTSSAALVELAREKLKILVNASDFSPDFVIEGAE